MFPQKVAWEFKVVLNTKPVRRGRLTTKLTCNTVCTVEDDRWMLNSIWRIYLDVNKSGGFYLGSPVRTFGEPRLAEGGERRRAAMNKATAPFVKCLKVFARMCACTRAYQVMAWCKVVSWRRAWRVWCAAEGLNVCSGLLGGGAAASPAVWPINQLSTPRHFGDNKNSSNHVNGLRVC